MKKNFFLEELSLNKEKICNSFPNKQLAESFITELYDFLFLKKQQECSTYERLEQQFSDLKNMLSRLIKSIWNNESKIYSEVEIFFGRLPFLYRMLLSDAESILKFDPAAQSLQEILTAYPGFYAIYVYRISHQLLLQNLQPLPRIISEYAHSKTGIDIHPAAKIGNSFFIDHGTGIVIGETAILGDNVKIYQGVTLGALSVSKNLSSTKRHPTIENNVTIYAGATILGGDTIIGQDSIIGGNVWLTRSVAPNSVVYHQSQISIKGTQPFEAILDFVI